MFLYILIENSVYSGIPISETLDFSNLPISRTSFLFPWINFSVILLSISQTPDFSIQFSPPLEVREIGTLL